MEVGKKLGPYEIIAPVGAGGMGEVYRAKDTRLNRTVAIKILPEHLSSSADMRQRFEREARMISSLNHPAICALYDIGEQNGTEYLVMEYLTGHTLRALLQDGLLSPRKAVESGIQIVSALAAAHEKGIVHRDLKPENIFITDEGRVKLLDFGLALAREEDQLTAGNDSITPTRAQMTTPGTVLGTVGYMSPEQVRGAAADARSDIFSFGAVLYEMLTGKRAFHAETPAETMTAILKQDPPEITQSAHNIPPALQRIVERCLQKKPDARFQTAHDLGFALEMSTGTSSTAGVTAAAPAEKSRLRVFRYVSFVALAALLGAAAFYAGKRSNPEKSSPVFRQLTFRQGYVFSARFAPDGQTIFYGAALGGGGVELYSTRTDSIESRSLGIKGDVVGISKTGDMALLLNRRHLGSWITVGTLAKVSMGGGSPREILENVNSADISPDGQQFAIVRQFGSKQRLEFPIGKTLFETLGWISDVRISPDGKHVVFAEHPVFGDDRGYVSLVRNGGEAERLTSEYSTVAELTWNADGSEVWFSAIEAGEDSAIYSVNLQRQTRLVFRSTTDLGAEAIDASGRILLSSGERRVEISGLIAGDTTERDLSWYGDEEIGGISADGTILAATQTSEGAGINYQVYFRRSDGSGAVMLGEGSACGITPDGKWVAAILPATDRRELLFYPTGPGQLRKIPLGDVTAELGGASFFISWSNDGSRGVFTGSTNGKEQRAYLLDFRTGKLRGITASDTDTAILSPAGDAVLLLDSSHNLSIHRISDGTITPVTGLLPDEYPVEWENSGTSIFVWDRSFPARVFLLDLSTGERTLWKEISPVDPRGVAYGRLKITRDGKYYLYRYRRILTRLHLAEGLQ